MKVLAIGNSFSEDATYYLKKIADSAQKDLTVVNLYIGGCNLETHAENIKENNALYRYELNGVYTDKMASIADTLKEAAWDIVTVQQQSGNAGIYESYGEHFKTVLECIKENAPKAKIYFHETWSYEWGSGHGDFPLYDKDQIKMDKAIKETVEKVCYENGNLPIIPSGDIIAEVRKNDAFNVLKGGESLCRDSFHTSFTYGRYLLGLVWFKVLLKGNISDVSFIPTEKDQANGITIGDFKCDMNKIKLIKDTIDKYI